MDTPLLPYLSRVCNLRFRARFIIVMPIFNWKQFRNFSRLVLSVNYMKMVNWNGCMRMKHDHYYKVLALRPLNFMRMVFLLLLRLIIWRPIRCNMDSLMPLSSVLTASLQGDVANKIGTYGVAVLAKFHNIPFLCSSAI